MALFSGEKKLFDDNSHNFCNHAAINRFRLAEQSGKKDKSETAKKIDVG
jgi:hypothetical protein